MTFLWHCDNGKYFAIAIRLIRILSDVAILDLCLLCYHVKMNVYVNACLCVTNKFDTEMMTDPDV